MMISSDMKTLYNTTHHIFILQWSTLVALIRAYRTIVYGILVWFIATGLIGGCALLIVSSLPSAICTDNCSPIDVTIDGCYVTCSCRYERGPIYACGHRIVGMVVGGSLLLVFSCIISIGWSIHWVINTWC